MTIEEFTALMNTHFLFQAIDRDTIMYAEHLATKTAKEFWPEVHRVDVTCPNGHDLHLDLVFNNEQDYVWWKLKYG